MKTIKYLILIKLFNFLKLNPKLTGVHTWMAKKQTAVATLWFEALPTSGATGVGHKPGVKLRVLHLTTVAQVASRATALVILQSTLRAENISIFI